MPPRVHDLIERQDAVLARQYTFTLSAKEWASYADMTITAWQLLRLSNAMRQNVPSVPGIYTLLVQPGIAKHPSCSYLMYVGQAVSLRARFGHYLKKERRATGRPKVFRMLNVYNKHVWFAFARVPKSRLDLVEDRLIVAHLPPCNGTVPAKLRKVVGAF